MHQQLAGELPPSGGRRGVVLSASKEVEPGARAIVLLAEGLFRLDVAINGDTLRTVVRNLSDGQMRMTGRAASDWQASTGFGEIAAYEPGRAAVEFELGEGEDRVTVAATVATLRFRQRGTVRLTAQAIIRQPPTG